jgi:hypothetical protein
VAAAVGGGLIATGVFTGSRPVTRIGLQRPVPLAARTAAVTGYIDACEGVEVTRPYHAAGTVTALRGRLTWKDDGRETRRLRLPPPAGSMLPRARHSLSISRWASTSSWLATAAATS